jgi:uncharacterized membrane protein (UPF0127 family)
MTYRSVLALSVLSLLGCGRSEEPAGARPARAATAEVAAPTRSTASAAAPAEKPRCVIATSTTPAAQAEPARHCPPDPTGNLSLRRGHVTFADAPGTPRVEVEVADQPEGRERGLMYRTGMPEGAGMLFSWPDEQVRNFWMRNTCLPLDMLFIDSRGFIVGILEQVPTMNEASRTIPCPATHVLELNAGWTRSHGVVAGQRLRIEP